MRYESNQNAAGEEFEALVLETAGEFGKGAAAARERGTVAGRPAQALSDACVTWWDDTYC